MNKHGSTKSDKPGILALILAGISAAVFAAFWIIFFLNVEIVLSPVFLLSISVFTLLSAILYLLIRKRIQRWKANLLAVGFILSAAEIIAVITVFARAILAF